MFLTFIRLLIIFCLVLNSGSVLFLMNNNFNYVLPVLVVFLYFISYFNKDSFVLKLDIKLILYSTLVVSFVNIFHIFYLEINHNLYFALAIKIISIILFLLYYSSKYNSFGKLIQEIFLILKIILIISLINIGMPHIFLSFFETNDAGVYVQTLYGIFNYASVINFSGFTIFRNQGLFWEPGVLQIFINLLLYMSLFVYKNSKISILSIVVIVSTFSTTGLLIMSILLLSYFFKNKPLGYRITGAVLIVTFFLPIISLVLYDKFTGNAALSASLRMYDLFVGFKIFFDNFLFGIGFDYTSYLNIQEDYTQSLLQLDASRGNTNGILSIGIYFGILMFLYIYMLFNQTIYKDKNLIFLILFLSLLSEPLSLSAFVLMFVLSSIMVNPKRSENYVSS